MSIQSTKPRGTKRALCSCRKCDDSCPEPGPSDACERTSSPPKRRRLRDLLEELFCCNEGDCEVVVPCVEDAQSGDCEVVVPCVEDARSSGDCEDDSDESEVSKAQPKPGKKRGSNYGTNMYNANKEGTRKGLRPIVIDGSNVAMGHSNGRFFSSKGLKICVDYFLERKHRVYVIVPHFRQCQGQARDQYILKNLYQQGHLYFTPSRMVDGRLEVPYDDRYIVQLAAATGGVIVSSDRYRDLLKENPRWAQTIKKRLLMFTWVDDILFFPQDPFGKRRPTLDELLRF